MKLAATLTALLAGAAASVEAYPGVQTVSQCVNSFGSRAAADDVRPLCQGWQLVPTSSRDNAIYEAKQHLSNSYGYHNRQNPRYIGVVSAVKPFAKHNGVEYVSGTLHTAKKYMSDYARVQHEQGITGRKGTLAIKFDTYSVRAMGRGEYAAAQGGAVTFVLGSDGRAYDIAPLGKVLDDFTLTEMDKAQRALRAKQCHRTSTCGQIFHETADAMTAHNVAGMSDADIRAAKAFARSELPSCCPTEAACGQLSDGQMIVRDWGIKFDQKAADKADKGDASMKEWASAYRKVSELAAKYKTGGVVHGNPVAAAEVYLSNLSRNDRRRAQGEERLAVARAAADAVNDALLAFRVSAKRTKYSLDSKLSGLHAKAVELDAKTTV